MELTMYTYFTELLVRHGAQEAVRFAKECGFSSVEILEIIGPGTAPLFPTEQQAQELRSHLEAAGLKCACYSVGIYLPADDLGPTHHSSSVEILKSCADRAHILGSPYLHHTLLPGRVCDDPPAKVVDRLLPTLLDRAGQVIEHCARYGMSVLYEPQGYYINGLDGFPRFYEAIKERYPTVGICGDVGNCLYANASPLAFFERYAQEIRHVHLKDLCLENENFHRGNTALGRLWDQTADGTFLTEVPLGDGEANVNGCMQLLRRFGYHGAWALETFYWDLETRSLAECLARDRDFVLKINS
jgi:sugar phosphate isomerase/epimerase